MPGVLPSGEQIEIRAGSQRVVVVEVGAGLRAYTVGDRMVIDGYGEPDRVVMEHALHPQPGYPFSLALSVGRRAHGLALARRELPVPRALHRRRSLAVEPMTCPPNALRTGEAVLVLEPGESTTSVWGIQSEMRVVG